jgi:hypothetical protein
LILKFLLGTSLASLEADLLLYSKQMKDLKRDQAHYLCKFLRQVFLNLMGRNNVEDPTLMTGDAMSDEDVALCQNNVFLRPGHSGVQSILLTYFGKHVPNADSTIESGHDVWAKANVATPNLMWDAFLKGVTFFAAARQTTTRRRRKYVKLGQLYRSKIKKWLDMGNPNVKHYESLLDAEFLALRGKNAAAMKQYEVSIVLAARGGYQHDAALASERLGEFHLTVMKDRNEAAYRLGQATNYWKSWGAMAKVADLEKKYSQLLQQELSTWQFRENDI